MVKSAIRRLRATLPIAAAIAFLPTAAGADGITQWWQYDKVFWQHSWAAHDDLKRQHDRWHRRNAGESDSFHHELSHKHRAMHYHAVLAKQSGNASWYDADGGTGACGTTLTGYYVAHPSWPCGSLVSIKRGESYILGRVRDRGPYTGGRVIDLSKSAFDALGDPSAGLMYVDVFRLEE